MFTFFLLCVLGKNALLDFLVLELGSTEYRRRERATEILGSLGPLAYPHLRKAKDSSDLEVRKRVSNLLRPLGEKVITEIAARQVYVMQKLDTPGAFVKGLGVIVSADGHEAHLFTDARFVNCEETIVEWKGKAYKARYRGCDGETWLTLYSMSCREVIPQVRFSSGPTKGLWWNYRERPEAIFEENMHLPGVMPGSGDEGAGVFSLDQTTLQPVLVGVYCGMQEIWDDRGIRRYWFVPGSKPLQAFLKKKLPRQVNVD